MSDVFVFKGKGYPSIGRVVEAIGTFNNLEEELEFLDAYCTKYNCGRANLSYFVNGNPYYRVYEMYHPLYKKLKRIREAITRYKG